MIEPGFGRPHGILELAEMRETVFDEVGEGGLGLFRGDGPIKVFERTGVAGKTEFDEFEDEFGGAVAFELKRGSQLAGAGFGKAASIFGVEVPTSAEGFLAIKEDFVFPAHFPIKELHAELFSAGGPGLKLFGGAEERAVGANFEWNAGLFGGEFEFSENAVVARFDKDEFSGAELGHRFDKLFPERMGIG